MGSEDHSVLALDGSAEVVVTDDLSISKDGLGCEGRGALADKDSHDELS